MTTRRHALCSIAASVAVLLPLRWETAAQRPPNGALFCPLCQPEFLDGFRYEARDEAFGGPTPHSLCDVFFNGARQTMTLAAHPGDTAHGWIAQAVTVVDASEWDDTGTTRMVRCPDCGHYALVEIQHGDVILAGEGFVG